MSTQMRCLQCAGSDWDVDSICFQVKTFRFSQTTKFFLDFWKWQNPPIHQQRQDEWKLEGELAILQNKHERIGQYLTNDLKKNVIVTIVYSFVSVVNRNHAKSTYFR